MEIIRNEYVYITFLESTYRKRKSKSKENSERNEIRFLTMSFNDEFGKNKSNAFVYRNINIDARSNV